MRKRKEKAIENGAVKGGDVVQEEIVTTKQNMCILSRQQIRKTNDPIHEENRRIY